MLRGFVIAWLLSFGPTVSNSFARFAYALVLPSMRADLAFDWSQAGALNTANAFGYLAGAVLARLWVGRAGNRALFAAGMLLTAGALFATGMVRDPVGLWLARGLSGVGGAWVFVCGGALSGNVFPGQPERATTTIAIYFAGAGIGLVVCGVAIPLWLEARGDAAWPAVWQGMGVVSLVMAVASLWAAAQIEEPATAPGSAQWSLRPFAMQMLAYVGFGLGYIGYMTFVIAWMRLNGASAGEVVAVWTVLGLATLQLYHVGEILEAPGGLLVRDQMMGGDHVSGHARERGPHPVPPGRLELDSVDRREDVHSQRGHADLEDQTGTFQVLRCQPLERRAKRAQRP